MKALKFIAIRNWSIRRKLWAGFGLVLIVLVFFGGYLFLALNWLQDSLVELQYKFDTLHQFTTLESDTNLLRSSVQTYIITSDDKWSQIYNDAVLRIDEALLGLRGVTEGEDEELLQEYKASVQQLVRIKAIIATAVKEGRVKQAQEIFAAEYDGQQAQTRLLLKKVEAGERRRVAGTISSSHQLLSFLQVSFAAMVGVLMVLTLLVSLVMTNELSSSIGKVLAGANAIAAGDLTRRVKVDSSDEVGRLAAHFNVMTESLEEKVGQIQRREKRLKQQNMELAHVKDKLEDAVRHLKKLDESKSEFVSIAAHQLRTPLTGIKWTLHSLVGKKKNFTINVRQRNMIRKAFNATSYMSDLVNNLLNVARMDEGKVILSLQREPFVPMVKDSVERFRVVAQERGVKLILKKLPDDKSVPEIEIDEQRLRIVFDNLLDNALKYTPEGGVVTVSMKREQKRVVVSVRDTGIGVPKDQVQRLFSKFYRSSNARLVHTSGSGLGLFLSKRVVEQHGGEMWFEGKEGKGSTFYFSLPLIRSA